MNIREEARKARLEAPFFSAADLNKRNSALSGVADSLENNKELIFEANKKDLELAKEARLNESVVKRLVFDEKKLGEVISGINMLISLPDPVGNVTLSRKLDDGLVLKRITCPIGVIGIIFESRPDALVQISSLCIKSANCAILKGGKESAQTNEVLFNLIHDVLINEGFPPHCLLKVSLHNEVDELLSCDGDVDLLIPRGSNSFVQYIMENTKIPVMGHADGVCHTYAEETKDIGRAVKIIIDAKTQYPAACNATETLLIKRSCADALLPELLPALKNSGVSLRINEEIASVFKRYPAEALPDFEIIGDSGYGCEYLDLVLAIKFVEDVNEAIAHINRYGSHHTDSIISDSEENIKLFNMLVDSAGVYSNCSTRFADGFRYGFGAEVGISTGKLHARGPVGLEGLVTYKYILAGEGHVAGDYVSGRKSFKFGDL